MVAVGKRLLQGEGTTGNTLSASTNSYKFALDLTTRLSPGTYRLQLYRHPRATRLPTIHNLTVLVYIDDPTATSAPKPIETSTSNSKLDHIIFSVGIPNVSLPVRYVCEGRSPTPNVPFLWTVLIDKQRTLPYIILQPITRMGKAIVRAGRHPMAYGARPMLGAAQNLGTGGGRLVRRATNIW